MDFDDYCNDHDGHDNQEEIWDYGYDDIQEAPSDGNRGAPPEPQKLHGSNSRPSGKWSSPYGPFPTQTRGSKY